jgi:predicted nucleic acid-binding protein
LLDPDDSDHQAAGQLWEAIKADERITTSYVLVETIALVQRRLSFEAVDRFRAGIEPLVDVIWVDEGLHAAGIAIWEAERRRHLSLVDCVSFACARSERTDAVFAFDPHFADQRFRSLA